MSETLDAVELKTAAIERAQAALFGQPLVTNTARGVLVEAMIANALAPEWRWCAADYASWDFESGDLRLEVKQSASLQNWNKTTGNLSACSFDIAYRSQAWEGGVWTKGRRRAAHLYVFAHHPLATDEADHRDPLQWDFYIIPTVGLPETSRISLSGVRRLTERFGIADLRFAVKRACSAKVTPPSP